MIIIDLGHATSAEKNEFIDAKQIPRNKQYLVWRISKMLVDLENHGRTYQRPDRLLNYQQII